MGPEKNISLAFKTALVTGGGGFVGKAVVQQLLKSGVKVKVLGRNKYPELESLGVSCIQGDISDEKAVESACSGVTVVFHVAALAGIWGSWESYFTTNVLGTENVVNGCRKNGVQALVYTSTPSVVFNRDDIKGADEGLPYPSQFLCNYAKSKVIAEKRVLSCNELASCALRPHLIWGPEDPHLLPRLIAAGRKKELQRVGDGTNLVDISYVDNVAYAHLLAAKNLTTHQSAKGEAYFISQDEPVNLWDWINSLFEMMGVEKINKQVPFNTAYKVGACLEVMHTLFRRQREPKMTRFLAEQLAKSHYFSCEKARSDLGYTPPISTTEGLQRTVKWLKDNGY